MIPQLVHSTQTGKLTAPNALSVTPPMENEGVCCRRCGYDLRGLKTWGRCPECGLWIEESLAFARTQQPARDRWRMGLANGAIWTLAAIILSAVALPFAFTVRGALGLTAWVAGTYGMWEISSRPSGLWLPRHLAIMRWGLRAGAVAATGMFLVFVGPQHDSDVADMTDLLVLTGCTIGQWAALLASPLLYVYLAASLRLLEHRRLPLVSVTVAGMLTIWSSLMVFEMHWPYSPSKFPGSFDRIAIPGLGATVYWAMRHVVWRGWSVIRTLDGLHLVVFGLGCVGTVLTVVLLPAAAHALLRDTRAVRRIKAQA